MRSRWKLVTFLGLVLLLVGSIVGCSESYTQEDLDAAYETGHAQGYDDGSHAGYKVGYGEGHATGKAEGYEAGSIEGYKVGYAEGKDAGLSELESELASTKQTLASTQEELNSTKQTLTKTQDKLEVIEAELLLSNIKVTNLSISPYYVEPGEKVTISANVINSGGIQLSYTAILRINGSEVERKSVVLNAGENEMVSFTVAKESAGNYTVELGGLADTFTVVESQIIEDLAYIKILAAGYSDDADPESDGISLRITFYDSKSEPIEFQGIPVTVTIELYGYTGQWGRLGGGDRGLVYRDKATIDHSEGFFGAEIKIPYENIMVDQSRYHYLGDMEVTVTTPKQGSFRDSWGLVSLYAE